LDSPGRISLRSLRAGFYHPSELATAMLTRLEQMEQESDKVPQYNTFRHRTGLTCAAEFREMKTRRNEDAITEWLSESFPNAKPQVADICAKKPDIVFAYERDEWGSDVFVFLEAKPLWKRWITAGEKNHKGTVIDHLGRGTNKNWRNNVRQLIEARDKLLCEYTDPRDRHVLLALIFQRPGEIDALAIAEVGPEWEHASRHVVDLCNPENDNIGLTAIVFWPSRHVMLD